MFTLHFYFLGRLWLLNPAYSSWAWSIIYGSTSCTFHLSSVSGPCARSAPEPYSGDACCPPCHYCFRGGRLWAPPSVSRRSRLGAIHHRIMTAHVHSFGCLEACIGFGSLNFLLRMEVVGLVNPDCSCMGWSEGSSFPRWHLHCHSACFLDGKWCRFNSWVQTFALLCIARRCAVGQVAVCSARSRGRYSDSFGAIEFPGHGSPGVVLAASTGSPAVSCSTADRSWWAQSVDFIAGCNYCG